MSEPDVRFAFGRNWQSFLSLVDEQRIADTEALFREMLGCQDLKGLRLLDIGSGSGISSLAARRLGARVHSFDNDSQSVAATLALKDRYRSGDGDWTVEEGSVLDATFMTRLGKFDVVVAWGVLHHTGAMWQALENAIGVVARGGRLWVALYNDQGKASVRWRFVKRAYNRAHRVVRIAIVMAVGLYFELRGFAGRLRRFENPFRRGASGSKAGMSRWHDLVDWVGGYPFEVARPDDVVAFARRHGLQIERLRTCGRSLGNDEYVFGFALAVNQEC